jgi:hypothetical protein
MELLDRYLQAVKKHLPWQRQDDIIAELKANLEAQLEDKEAALGRPLTNDEAMAWLKQLGSPVQMAAPYQAQQYLIGPAIFPTYRYVLQLACTWAVVINVVVIGVKLAFEENTSPAAWLEVLQHVPFTLLLTAAWVTLIFAAIEFAVAHSKTKWMPPAAPSASWSPVELPPLGEGGVAGKKPRSYSKAVAEVIFGFLFLIWLLLVPRYPYLWVGPGAPYLLASPFTFAPICVQFFWWVVVLNAFQLIWHCVDLLRGTWQRQQPVKLIVMKVFGLIPLTLLLNAPEHAIVLLKHPALDQARYGETLAQINKGLHQALTVLFVIVALLLAWDIGKMIVGLYRKRVAAMG